jgi:putative transposase
MPPQGRQPEDLIGENGLLKQLTKLLVEKALEAEMADHLGHGKNEPVENPAGNTRNGKSRKTLKGEFGELPIEIPRDRHGTFEPQFIPKHQTRWTGFDDKILSLYARRDDGPRNPVTLERDERHRGVANADFIGHRCRD